MNFLPEDYQAPKPVSQNYFKLQDGENRVRILSRPVIGWEDWTLDRKPVRFRMNEKPAKSIDAKKPVKHFWAFVVWNVNQEEIQLMQITQATIRSSLEALSKDNDWGSPFEYDIKIFKKGEKMETEYTVNPVPHKPVSAYIIQAFKDKPINLSALFTDEDPFSSFETGVTCLMTEEKITPITDSLNVNPLDIDYISTKQATELTDLFNGCSEEKKAGFKEHLKKMFSTDDIAKIPENKFYELHAQLLVRFQENQKDMLEAEMSNKTKRK
jgi:hypothetical protein